ncbi:hypothetical protein FRB98_006563 [Tulasnella sp. 332]|nr:hypothetical protein FRB98_006563 [Tulasnella sp. 332]
MYTSRPSKRWDDAVTRIRALPEFTTFLRPTPFNELAHAADEGPVIIVNISDYRCDAIILRSGAEPSDMELPTVTRAKTTRMTALMEEALGSLDDGHRESGVEKVLNDLWVSVVQLVVQRLEEDGVPRGSRIWWCPTSALCLLPLHAAGVHQKQQSEPSNLLDTFVSSYTTTLSALVRARKRKLRSAERPRALAV